jgi:pectin lyase
MRTFLITAICTTLWSPVALAQVVGTSFGFASGTTGGGSAQPAAPSNIAELV